MSEDAMKNEEYTWEKGAKNSAKKPPKDLLIQIAQNGFYVTEQEPLQDKVQKAFDRVADIPAIPFVFETVEKLNEFLLNYYK
ncbi:MAG: hypothetical protein ACM3QX_18305 [Syntrophomonadaceae bacterium]